MAQAARHRRAWLVLPYEETALVLPGSIFSSARVQAVTSRQRSDVLLLKPYSVLLLKRCPLYGNDTPRRTLKESLLRYHLFDIY